LPRGAAFDCAGRNSRRHCELGEIERKESLDLVECSGNVVHAHGGTRSLDLLGRPAESLHGASALCRAKPREFLQVLRRLNADHSVPPVRHHASEGLSVESANVEHLERRSFVDQTCAVRVRAQEHRAVTVPFEKRLQSARVTRAEHS
jgi:hypothetical protein